MGTYVFVFFVGFVVGAAREKVLNFKHNGDEKSKTRN